MIDQSSKRRERKRRRRAKRVSRAYEWWQKTSFKMRYAFGAADYDIKLVVKGKEEYPSGLYAIFVLYANGPLPLFTKNILEALNAEQVNVIVLSNGALADSAMQQLLGLATDIAVRGNQGRDFGAYKDGIRLFFSKQIVPKRLIILNDSVFYPSIARATDFVKRFSVEEDNSDVHVLGLTENPVPYYHLSSYAMSFSAAVINDLRFQEFWNDYRPVNSRRWAIHKGELKLSSVLVEAGYFPAPTLRASTLVSVLESLAVSEFISLGPLIPKWARMEFYGGLQEILATHSIIGSDLGGASSVVLTTVPQARIFISKLVSVLSNNNQMHSSGLLFYKYLNSPAIKRDLVFREQFDYSDVLYCLSSETESDSTASIMVDLYRKGYPNKLSKFELDLYRAGSL